MKGQEGDEEDFRHKRETFSVNIRRTMREDKFNQMRKGNSSASSAQGMEQQLSEEARIATQQSRILDDRYSNEIRKFSGQKYTLADYENLKTELQSKDIVKMHRGLIGMRRLMGLQAQNSIIERFMFDGLLPLVLECVAQNEYQHLKLEGASILANIASGSYDSCRAITAKGAIDIFIALLSEPEPLIVNQGVWGIGNLAAEDTSFRDKILSAAGVNALLNVIGKYQAPELYPQNQQVLKNSVWALSNLCRGNPRPKPAFVDPAMPILCKATASRLLPSTVQADCYWAISAMTCVKACKGGDVIEQGLLPVLFEDVFSNQSRFYTSSLKIIGNMTTEQKLRGLMVKEGLIEVLCRLIDHSKSQIRRQVYWIFSNLASDREITVKLLNHPTLSGTIAEKLKNEETEVKREICWVVTNFVTTGKQNVVLEYLTKYQILQSFSLILEQPDSFTLETCLECLSHILLVGRKWNPTQPNLLALQFQRYQGGERLAQLQKHPNKRIYDRVVRILKKHFEVEETAMI